MNAHGLGVSEEAMHPWHGAKKEAVIEHFLLEDQLAQSLKQLDLENGMVDPKTARLAWDQFDTNKDGVLRGDEIRSFTEAVCQSKGFSDQEELYDKVMTVFGQNNDEQISWKELQGKVQQDEFNAKIEVIGNQFLDSIDAAYFDEASPVEHIDLTLVSYFRQLKSAGIKVALDTGYPPKIQMGLMKKMNFDKVVDGYVSAYQVKQGRPYPYMIFRLMEDLNILSVRHVAKAGDFAREIWRKGEMLVVVL
mmetsp:Transcript_14590/g.28566  ORF Transcript_14590/g.28566 Transcript_14590/m.28566 type:complete len:249 (-) Transcript_14590:283-1029(-)